jgi:hypothetical protein
MTACSASQCSNNAQYQWQRWATPQEVEQWHISGDLPLSENEARVPVYACEDDKFTSAQMGYTHDASCHGPGEDGCDCSKRDLPPFIGTDASIEP